MSDHMSTALIANNKNKIRFEAIARLNLCTNMNNNSHVTYQNYNKREICTSYKKFC